MENKPYTNSSNTTTINECVYYDEIDCERYDCSECVLNNDRNY